MTYRVGWVLVGDQITGSSRITAYHTHNYLIKQGIMSSILVPQNQPQPYFDYYPVINPQQPLDFDIVVFQKVRGNSILEAINLCKKRGIPTIYELDDYRPESGRMGRQCDTIVVPAEYIKQKMFYGHPNTIVIQQGHETPPNKYKTEYKHQNKACYVYSAKFIPDDLLPTIKESGWELTTIGRHKTDTYIWNLDTLYDYVMRCDIGIVPADVSSEEGRAKSWNRAILFMSLGLPVIVSVVPEYYNIVRNGINGFIAYTKADWIKYLNLLKDPVLCEKMGRQAREDSKNFTTEWACEKYYKLFHKIVREKWLNK